MLFSQEREGGEGISGGDDMRRRTGTRRRGLEGRGRVPCAVLVYKEGRQVFSTKWATLKTKLRGRVVHLLNFQRKEWEKRLRWMKSRNC